MLRATFLVEGLTEVRYLVSGDTICEINLEANHSDFANAEEFASH